MMQTKTHHSDDGFTLLEVMITLVVMTLGIFSLFTMQLSSIRANTTSKNITIASTLVGDQVERIIGLTYRNVAADPDILKDNITTVDRDGNAANLSDINGLDADTEATADSVQYVTDTGEIKAALLNTDTLKFTIYTNIAADYPVQDSRTVRIIIQWREGLIQKSVQSDYVKTRS